jgi:hypothetical protein
MPNRFNCKACSKGQGPINFYDLTYNFEVEPYREERVCRNCGDHTPMVRRDSAKKRERRAATARLAERLGL